MQSVIDEIKRLKKEKNAVILAHYYVNDEVQDIAATPTTLAKKQQKFQNK